MVVVLRNLGRTSACLTRDIILCYERKMYLFRRVPSLGAACLGQNHIPSRTLSHLYQPKMSLFAAIPMRTDLHLISGQIARPLSRFYSSGRQWDFYANYKTSKRFVLGLVGVNIAGWGLWQYSLIPGREKSKQSWLKVFDTPDWLIANATNSLQNVREGRYWTMFTSAFSHIQLSHLVGTSNCLTSPHFTMEFSVSPNRIHRNVLLAN